MLWHHIYLIKQMLEWVGLVNKLENFPSRNSDGSLNVTCKWIAKFGSNKVNVLLISVQSREITSSWKNSGKSARSCVGLESTSDVRIVHKPALSDETVTEMLSILFASFLDLCHLGNDSFHVGQLFLVCSFKSEHIFPLVVFLSVVEKDQNSAAFVLRWNIVTHV